jgi:Gnt-I system low-affinity gluconate transporter
MSITGFIIAIPVFFDVAFIILIPVIYALATKTKNRCYYMPFPLLAGLAATHSFIPPTPGPVAVTEILGANLGWVILMGFIVGIPVVILAGPVFGSYIGKRMFILPPGEEKAEPSEVQQVIRGEIPKLEPSEVQQVIREEIPKLEPSQVMRPATLGHLTNQVHVPTYPAFRLVIFIIGCPLVLILANTITGALVKTGVLPDNFLTSMVQFAGHPFTALIIATLLAMYFLGTKRGTTKKQLQEISTVALGPAGVIILITGAGGVLKQVLIDSGIGDTLAAVVATGSINPIVLGWMVAAVVRVTQGSSTVAMITAAGIMAPIMTVFDISQAQEALVVISIAAGATILSHVNDSGFWLVGKYLGLDEKQTLQTWTVMETIIAVSGLAFAWLLYQLPI